VTTYQKKEKGKRKSEGKSYEVSPEKEKTNNSNKAHCKELTNKDHAMCRNDLLKHRLLGFLPQDQSAAAELE
jgi:hypothetical protein